MGNFTYLTHEENAVSADACVVTGSTTASSSYAASNTKSLPIAKHWRSTGVSSENLQIDLGSAKTVDLIGIVNHNLTSSAVITVYAGSAANPDGTQFSTTISWREFDAFKLMSTAQTYRYWKFIFANGSNPDGYIRVGYLLVGNSTTFDFHWQYGAKMTDRFVNLDNISAGGVPYVETKYGIIIHSFEFGPLSVTNMVTLRTLYRDLMGSAKPLFIIPESQTNDGYFGRFINDFARTLNYYEYANLDFREDGRGRSISA